MEIIVTDVTDMSGGKICVAGWCKKENRMIRPLAGVGEHWSSALAKSGLFHPGAVIEFAPSGIATSRGLPHATEDVVVSSQPRKVNSLNLFVFVDSIKDSLSPSVSDIFSGKICGNNVSAGSKCRSLGGILIPTSKILFSKKTWEGVAKLRCCFTDGRGHRYDFAVSASDLKSTFRQCGDEELNRSKAGKSFCHLRIGLTHPYDGECVAMVNGAYFY